MNDWNIRTMQVPVKPTTARLIGSSSVHAKIVFVTTVPKARTFVHIEGTAIFRKSESISMVAGGEAFGSNI